MKSIKLVVVIMVLIVLFPNLKGMTSGEDFELLLQKAYRTGDVRVILSLDVPDIEKLTAESNKIKTGDLSPAAKQDGFDADLKLEKGISSVSDKVLYRLNNVEYRLIRRFETLPLLAISVSPEALIRLKNITSVKAIYEDKLIPLPKIRNMVPDDDIPVKPQLIQSASIVGADKAWSMGITGAGWYIAILDTGIRTTHEMFKGKDIVEACYSAESDCPNGSTQMEGPGAAEHYYDYNYLSGYDHGTHVSGIAAGDNGGAVAGISKGSNIIAIQVFSYFPSEDDILSWSSDQIKGLERVYQLRTSYNIAAANLSLGGGEYSSFCNGGQYDDAITNLLNVGIATVIASGNEYFCKAVSHPACYERAIAVGATAKNDTMANFSNWKKGMIDLFAPGVSIYSSVGGNDTAYSSWQGTSMAAPHVAGAWGLLKQMDRNMSVGKVLKLLQDYGKMVNTSCSTGGQAARFDVGKAVTSLLDVAPPINFSGEQKENRALLQVEYFNSLTWDSNPYNSDNGKNIVKYRVYRVVDSVFEQLAELDSNVFVYSHRKVTKGEKYTYAIKAVTDSGKESIPAYVDVEGAE